VLLQAPQFQGSVCASTHFLLHQDLPTSHRAMHLPVSQRLSSSHVAPHAPQFVSSAFTSTQAVDVAVPHFVLFPSHPHVPASQCVSPSHLRLHAPQFESLVFTSMHALPHTVSPCAHFETHFPLAQSSPVWHALPHPPQLAASAL
jgi:hypothetical protein